MLRLPNVLLLSSAAAETEMAKDLLGEAANLMPVRTLTELKETADRLPYDALFCGRSFHGSRWKDAVSVIQIILGDVPVIFFSLSQDDPEDWKKVLDAGGFDLLLPPYSEFQTRAALGQAVESNKARRRNKCGSDGLAASRVV